MTYAAVKSIHLICVVPWFAAMFYIFRLFVYHSQNLSNEAFGKVFFVMERKLIGYIMLPAALASLLSGVSLLWLNPALLMRHWLWLKLLFVALLLAYNALALWVHKRLGAGYAVLSERYFRLINEVPTIALIAISVLVFLKPEIGQ